MPGRGTRSRKRVLRRCSSENPSLGNPSLAADVSFSSASLSADEEQWEDISSASDHDGVPANSLLDAASISALRRRGILNTPRRRKRAEQPPAVERRWITTDAVPALTNTSAPAKRLEPVHEQHEHPTIMRSILQNTQALGPRIPWKELTEVTTQTFAFTIRYLLDVARIGLALLRRPLGFVLALLLLAALLSKVSQTLQSALAPLCWLPILSSSIACRPIPPNLPQRPDYRQLVEAQTKTFEYLLDETTMSSVLSLEVKKAQMATSDLIAVVRHSHLRSKEALVPLLLNFVHDAKETGRRLQKLHAKVGGSVDSIMAVNSYAFRTIEEANSKKSIYSLIRWSQPHKTRLVASTFKDAMDTLSTQITHLIIEAEANLGNLNDLEEGLDAIHGIVSRDVNQVTVDRDELLAELWTILGGNRRELKSFNDNLALLKDLGNYRRRARVHVVSALQTLQSLSADMEELRERVALPGLVGENIPLEVQMQSIKYGLERLQQNRDRTHKAGEDAVRRITGWVDEINV